MNMEEEFGFATVHSRAEEKACPVQEPSSDEVFNNSKIAEVCDKLDGKVTIYDLKKMKREIQQAEKESSRLSALKSKAENDCRAHDRITESLRRRYSETFYKWSNQEDE